MGYRPGGRKESDTTWRLNNNDNKGRGGVRREANEAEKSSVGLAWWSTGTESACRGPQVQSLIEEDSTCQGATNPSTSTLSLRSRACEPQLLRTLNAVPCDRRSRRDEKPTHGNKE